VRPKADEINVQLNLAHGKNEKIRKQINKNRIPQKNRSRTLVREGSPGGRMKLRFVKQPRAKERGMDLQNGESEEEVVNGEGIVESEMEELVPE